MCLSIRIGVGIFIQPLKQLDYYVSQKSYNPTFCLQTPSLVVMPCQQIAAKKSQKVFV